MAEPATQRARAKESQAPEAILPGRARAPRTAQVRQGGTEAEAPALQHAAELAEGIRALECLLCVSRLTADPFVDPQEVLKELAEVLPMGWAEPWSVCARVMLEGRAYCGLNFRESDRREAVEIRLDGQVVGAVEVHYTRGRPNGIPAAQLVAQRHLLAQSARDLAKFVERRRRLEGLLAGDVPFRKLVENLPQKVFCKDSHGRYLVVNHNFARDLGLTPDQVAGKTDYDFFPRELADKYRADDARVRASGSAQEFEEAYVQGGQERIVHTTKAPLKDEQGRSIGVMGVFWDVTERRQAQAQLLASEKRYRARYESMPDGFVRKDMSGRFLEFNPAYLQMLGYSEEELKGKSYQDITPEKWHPIEARIMQEQVLQRGHSDFYEKEYRRKDGTVFPVELRVFLWREEEGGAPSTWAIVRDITARRRAEESAAKALHDVERSNKELEQFAYVASHDLQEPLRMVASYTQLLARRYGEKLDPDAKQFIAYAVDGANRMQRSIHDLLMYSRLSSRAQPLAPTDAHAALGEALANLSLNIKEAGAIVTNDELPTVKVDHSQLVQVFQNLIGNAVKFHGPEPPRVHVRAERGGGEWTFSVRDNGIGIAPEHFERIFVLFQRLHARADHPGTGIGLAVCRRIVERHGGKIWVESARGKGATFHFTLPA